MKLNIKKPPDNPIQKWTEDLNRHFFKEYIQMAKGHITRCSASLVVAVLSLSRVCLYVTPWTITCQTPVNGIFQARKLDCVATVQGV